MKFAADHPVHLVLGLSIWSIWFIAIYAGLSVFCAHEENTLAPGFANPLSIGLLSATLIASLILGLLARWCWRKATGFPAKISAGLYAASMLATLAVGAPIAFLPPCW